MTSDNWVDLIAAFGGLMAVVVSLVTAWGVYRARVAQAQRDENAAKTQAKRDEFLVKRDELQLLRDEVTRLNGRVDTLTTINAGLMADNTYLQKRVAFLEATLIRAGIPIPKMPEDYEDSRHKAVTQEEK